MKAEGPQANTKRKAKLTDESFIRGGQPKASLNKV
jgi:hypothetical protein